MKHQVIIEVHATDYIYSATILTSEVLLFKLASIYFFYSTTSQREMLYFKLHLSDSFR